MDDLLTHAIVAFLRENRGPDGAAPDYGISATLAEQAGARIDITLVFKRGARYCCAEPGCHLGLFRRARWAKLRRCLEEAMIELPIPMTIHVRGVVESGALLDSLKPLGMEAATSSYEYETEYAECGGDL